MDKSITLRDFSGGLNTTAAAATLKPDQSPDLLNVEVMDSRAIRRRKGFLNVAQPNTRPMRALYRYYKADGTKRWLALCGTGLYVTTGASVRMEGSWLYQAETLAAPATRTYDNALSGGSAARIATATSTYTVPVPYSNSVIVGVAGDTVQAAIDGGSYVSPTSNVISFTGLTATNHTLAFRAVARNNSSLKMTMSGENQYRKATRALPAQSLTAARYYSVRFYDDGVSMTYEVMNFLWDGSSLSTRFGIGIRQASTYQVVSGSGWENTTIPRTAGWHTVTYIVYRMGDTGEYVYALYLDGTNRYEPTWRATSAPHLGFTVGNNWTSTTTGYFDEVRITGDGYAALTLWEDFTSLSAWTFGGTATTYTESIDTSFYTSDLYGLVDTVQATAEASGTKIATLANANAAMLTFADKVFFADSATALRSYDGSTVAAITASGAAPPAAYLTTKQNRIFAAGKSTAPALMEYSAVGTGLNWTGGGALKSQAQEEWGNTTGLAVWRDALWRFGNTTTHALNIAGEDTSWANKTVSNRHGCIAPKTLVAAPNALVFLSGDGVRAYGTIDGLGTDDGSGFLLVSQDIIPTIARITASAVTKCCAEFYQNRYFLSVPLDGAEENTHTLVYRMPDQAAGGSWTLYDYGVTCLHRTRGDEDGLYAGTESGVIVKLETGSTDNGSPIPMRYVIPPIPSPKAGSGFASVKHFGRIYISAEAGAAQTLIVTPSGDDAPGYPLTLDIDQTTGLAPVRKPVRARGRSMSLAFDSSGGDQDITISEVTLTYSERMR